MVVRKYYDELPTQIPYVIDPTAGPHYDDLDERGDAFDDWAVTRTDDLSVAWSRADPGAFVDWHSHGPDYYQIHVIISGRIRWHYKDNDGEEQYVEAGPREVVYLPAGSENRIEVVGDEELEKIVVSPRLHMTRMEYFLKDGGYRRQSEYGEDAALVFDSSNDRVVSMTEDAILNLDEIEEELDSKGEQDTLTEDERA